MRRRSAGLRSLAWFRDYWRSLRIWLALARGSLQGPGGRARPRWMPGRFEVLGVGRVFDGPLTCGSPGDICWVRCTAGAATRLGVPLHWPVYTDDEGCRRGHSTLSGTSYETWSSSSGKSQRAGTRTHPRLCTRRSGWRLGKAPWWVGRGFRSGFSVPRRLRASTTPPVRQRRSRYWTTSLYSRWS